MRPLNAQAEAALEAPTAALVLLLEMQFPSGAVRLNSSPVSFPHDGVDWLGAGSMGEVQPVRDTVGEVAGLQFTLSGVPSENLALALAEKPRGKPCRLWVAILDPDSQDVLDTALLFPGYIDQMTVQESPDGKCALSVSVVHAGHHLQRPKPLRYTDGDQRRIAPGDTSMRFLISQAQHQDVWPAASFFRQ